MSHNASEIEHFFGVYLLYCTNPKYKGRTYIGYTVDPNRRIKQHNKGKKAGGAWRTSNKGPWTMAMIIHGFPNEITALRFEWAWQHPTRSRRLSHLARRKPREKAFDYCLRVLSEMLQVGPWHRLPLTVRWLNDDFARELDKSPPIHMPICYGPVVSKKLPKSEGTSGEASQSVCTLCFKPIEDKPLKCVSPECVLTSHVICLGNLFCKPGEYVPVEGQCPSCKQTFLWGDLVRKYKGCYSDLDIIIEADMGDDFYCSDSN